MKLFYDKYNNTLLETQNIAKLLIANLAEERVHIYDIKNPLIDFILGPNEISKIEINNGINSNTSFVAYSANNNQNSYMMNGESTFHFPAVVSNKPKILIIHKESNNLLKFKFKTFKDDNRWFEIQKKLQNLQNESVLINQYTKPTKNISTFDLTLRINLMTPTNIMLKEISGTNFKVGLRSALAKNNIATDLELSLNVSSNHCLIFSAISNENGEDKKILINGLAEWKLGEIQNITGSILPVIMHELGNLYLFYNFI